LLRLRRRLLLLLQDAQRGRNLIKLDVGLRGVQKHLAFFVLGEDAAGTPLTLGGADKFALRGIKEKLL
jgi:hypothetical protein